MSIDIDILTEGSQQIGFGHLSRCIGLYQAFRKLNFNARLIVNGDSSTLQLLTNKKFIRFDWLHQKEELFSHIKNTDILVFDSYLSDKKFYENIAGTGKTIVYIDDNNRLPYPSPGIVLNGNIYAPDLKYPQNKEIVYLLGPAYTPLRKEFWDVDIKKINSNLQNILITLGGSDVRNMTAKIVKLILNNINNVTIDVIISKGFAETTDLKKIKQKQIRFIYYPTISRLRKLIQGADLAIISGGQTTYEMLRTGTPAISIAFADNQLNNVKKLHELGLIQYSGFYSDKNLDKNILDKISKLQNFKIRKKIATSSQALINGQGAFKTVRSIIRYFITNNSIIRRAEQKDLLHVLHISNEPKVRKSSFNSSTITLQEHTKWFSQKIKEKDCIFLVMEFKQKPIAQLRLDMNNGKAIISISVSDEYKNFGLGSFLVKKAIEILHQSNSDVHQIIAEIKHENEESIAFFKTLQFIFTKVTIVRGHKALEFILKI